MTMGRRCLAMVTCALAVFAAHASGAEWKPGSRVELIVPNAAGGGNDRFTRIVQKIAQENRIVDAIITVVNKPGGGGMIGLNYLNEHTGNGNYLSIISATFLGNHVLGHSTTGPEDITPVAQLLTEYLGFAVKPDSPLKNGKDLVARLKGSIGSISTSISGTAGNHNYVALSLVARATGADPRQLKIVYFSGGSEAIAAALGGHVDLLVAPAATILPYARDGRLRFLAITAPKRLAGPFADIPTWRELGTDVTTSDWRAMVGPRGMKPEQVAYWEDVLGKVVNTDEWKTMLERTQLSGDFLNGAAMRAELKSEDAELRALMTQMGLIKR